MTDRARAVNFSRVSAAQVWLFLANTEAAYSQYPKWKWWSLYHLAGPKYWGVGGEGGGGGYWHALNPRGMV